MQRAWKSAAALCAAAAVAVAGGCKNPPTKEEMAKYDYGPRPDDYQKLVKDYLWPKLLDPGNAIVEFKAGPRELFQQETALRSLQYGWGVCVFINDKNKQGAYDGFYPMSFLLRNEKIVAANGGTDDNVIGATYAREHCERMGSPFKK